MRDSRPAPSLGERHGPHGGKAAGGFRVERPEHFQCLALLRLLSAIRGNTVVDRMAFDTAAVHDLARRHGRALWYPVQAHFPRE
jgi:hypothetical protein